MKTVKFSVEKEGNAYTAAAPEFSIYDYASTLAQLNANVRTALALQCEEMGEDVNQYEVVFEYDIPSLFDAYNYINAKSFAARIGMNNVLLNQYTQGAKKPSAKQKARIEAGFQTLAQELAAAHVGA